MTREEINQLDLSLILWDDLDEAIIGIAKRENFGSLFIYNLDGEVKIKLDEEFYSSFDEGDDLYDAWSRPTFEVVAYDTGKIIDILANKFDTDVTDEELEDGLTLDDIKKSMALEYFEYNIAGGYVGESTPIHLILTNNE